MSKRRRASQVSAVAGARQAHVIVPVEFEIPESLELPDELPELPEPHHYIGHGVESWRAHRRSHHRMVLVPPRRKVSYVRKRVWIPRQELDGWSPFITHWKQEGANWVIVNHWNPDRKVDRMINRRMRDNLPDRDWETNALPYI